MSIYIAHYRNTSNALNALVPRKQKVFNERLNLSVRIAGSRRSSGKLFQTVWPATKRTQTTVRVEPIARHDQKMAAGGTQTLPCCNIGDQCAVVHQVLKSLAVQTPLHHRTEFVNDSLRNVEPMKLGMHELR
jgi:hypothetical protein